ncbi:Ig-like domain-containing protein, partial [Planctomycetota bacterium]
PTAKQPKSFLMTVAASDSGTGLDKLTVKLGSPTGPDAFAPLYAGGAAQFTYQHIVDAVAAGWSFGANDLYISVSDKAGNVATTTLTLFVDTEMPAAVFDPSTGSRIQTLGSFTVTLSDGTSADNSGINETETLNTLTATLGGNSFTAFTASTAASGNDVVVTLAPTTPSPAADGDYAFEITPKDVAGNVGTKVAASYTLDGTRPIVDTHFPTASATDTSTAAHITAKFSEAVDAGTVNDSSFTIQGPGAFVTGTVTYVSDTLTATFAPGQELATNTQYIVTISSAVLDLAGNPLVDKTFVFTTSASLAEKLAFISQPQDVGAGRPITPAVTVAIQDNSSNTVASNAPVTVEIAQNTLDVLRITEATETSLIPRVVDPQSAIVGSWGPGITGTQAGEIFSLTFYGNGTYIHWQNGDQQNPTEIGVEYGFYTWNSGTGVLTPSPIFNENKSVGLSDPNTPGATFTVTVAGDVMSIADSGGSSNMDRVVDATDPIVGSWGPGYTGNHPGGVMSLTLFKNGTYLHWQNGDDTNANWVGVEHGTWSVNPTTGVLSVTINSDQNGEVGLSHPIGGPLTLATGGRLSGTKTVNAVNGVATFSNLMIDAPGTDYTLRATSGSLTPDDSTAFEVQPVPEVAGHYPPNGATDVSTGANLVFRFTDSMDRTSVETAIIPTPPTPVPPGGGPSVAPPPLPPLHFFWSADSTQLTAAFDTLPPTDRLDSNELLGDNVTYFVTIGAQARSQSGVSLGQDFNFSFTTRDSTPPTVTGTNPDVNGVLPGAVSSFTVYFSEPMNGQLIDFGVTNFRPGPAQAA